MKRTIIVEGTGKVKAKPDLISLEFRLHSEDFDYEKAMGKSNSQYDKLTKGLKNAGFNKEDLKTKEMKVLTKYEQEHDGRVYRQIFKGYEITYHLEIMFTLDLNRLNGLLGEIAATGSTPEFSVLFLVSDDKELRNEALALATEEAKARGEVIAEAMGIKLGHIRKIKTLENGEGFPSRIEYPTMKMRTMNLDITPQDVENVEKVQITFHIL
ncbi:MAG: SIMPL domain-containing protein [Clostridium sp.]|nr:SIMPL domain-containing protein [Clostridium sp.]